MINYWFFERVLGSGIEFLILEFGLVGISSIDVRAYEIEHGDLFNWHCVSFVYARQL